MSKFQISVIALFLIALAFACHPQSRWLCDNPCGAWECNDPVCDVICEPICNNTCMCHNPTTNSSYPLKCYEVCPPDQCEADSCPACETHCPKSCRSGFDALCEATSCDWSCRANTSCPYPECEQISTTWTSCPEPRCELQSEKPACEHSSSSRNSVF